MTCLNLTRIPMAWVLTLIFVSLLFPQNAPANQGGTVRGRVMDATPSQNPLKGVRTVIIDADGIEYETLTDSNGDFVQTNIPAQRYLINVYKEGYGERLGKPVTVVNGGDHYVRLRMAKLDNIATFFFKRFGVILWVLFFWGISVLLTFFFTKRWVTKKMEAERRR